MFKGFGTMNEKIFFKTTGELELLIKKWSTKSVVEIPKRR